MIVMMLERVPVGLRGELTRWLLEARTGVFVGTPSALVRDKLWEKVQESRGVGAAMLIHSSNNEQGFAMRMSGDPRRVVEDFEGLSLIRIP